MERRPAPMITQAQNKNLFHANISYPRMIIVHERRCEHRALGNKIDIVAERPRLMMHDFGPAKLWHLGIAL